MNSPDYYRRDGCYGYGFGYGEGSTYGSYHAGTMQTPGPAFGPAYGWTPYYGYGGAVTGRPGVPVVSGYPGTPCAPPAVGAYGGNRGGCGCGR